MNFLKNRFFSPLTSFSLLALLSLGTLSTALAAPLPLPASDLTVTVQELENGDVEFSLSGTAYFEQDMTNPFRTPADFTTDSPPHNLPEFQSDAFSIPQGLIITTPDNSAPPGISGPTRDISLDFLDFSSGGYWSFYSFSSGTLNRGDKMEGSGTVVTDEIPFSHFGVGTFAIDGSEFDMIYKIIPYAPPSSPKVVASRTSRFGSTRVRSSSRTSRIVIRNTGDSPVERLSVRISGRGSRDFRIRKLPSSKINPGRSTFLRAQFRPRAVGNRRAVISLLSNAPTRKITLKGKGLRPRGTTSPRFPGI